MQAKEHTSLNKLKSIRPRPMALHSEQLIQTTTLPGGEALPLVIHPREIEVNLIDWARSNGQFIESSLLKYGALLFRGFNISSPLEFEQFAATLCPDLFSENGEHPREEVSGNVYTPVFYPPEKKLLWHNENSFNASWPMKIWFFCSKPADEGGETPIADSREVFQRISPRTREEFLNRRIMYIRNYGTGLGLDWQTVFRATRREEVEEYCRREAIEFEWGEGDRLKTRQVRPAVAKHPVTGELTWWNQATHWHTACLEPEVRHSLLAMFGTEGLPRSCSFGDGSVIEDAIINEINAAYQAAEISFPWQQGDILTLDNMLVAHARNPFKGQRKLYVSMGNMLTLKDLAE